MVKSNVIDIYEPELAARRGFNGFYRHFLSALVDCCGARPTDEERPLPRMTKPREHESCWIKWNGNWVLFDMSDHVQLLDLEALELCSVYFKANLHRGIANRILCENDLLGHQPKLVPFLFFSEGLAEFIRDAKWRRILRRDRPSYDVCFVMGVYENLVRDGEKSPFEHMNEPITPASYHFWIRWHIMTALKEAGIPGYYRLTSRANRALEDDCNVNSNLLRREFSRKISAGRITTVCTLPHALFPWKASESFVLGRPLLIEQAPLTETPEPFTPVAGKHYMELLPEIGTFNSDAPQSEPGSYRLLKRIPVERFHQRAEWLRAELTNRERFAEMGESCRLYAEHAYKPETVATYIRDEIEKRI